MFYDALRLRSSFSDLADPAQYTPLPDDWVVGTSDIVGSTAAVAAGKYKTVNMIGAAVISAQINAAGGRAFPYVFGGDGAAFAHPPEFAETAAQALAAVQVWATEEFDMGLRVGLFRVADIRAAGRDVAVARYAVSDGVDYAMFAGGGISWAEERMKAGVDTVPAAAPGTWPDLTGLSCRWNHMAARNGTILSLLVQPAAGAEEAAFARVTQAVLDAVAHLRRNGHPSPAEGPGFSWPPPGAGLEVSARPEGVTAAKRKRQIWIETAMAWVFLTTRIKLGGFDPAHYQRTVGANADYRKFDDGLKMTIDCDADTVSALRRILDMARAQGIADYGMHTQDEAMMTCIVPSIMEDTHVHFIDGAAGGYTQASVGLKARA
ncbi:DUF3095 domain-containing protein [uncultured Tateyamaria sp.]|uniref:DUF3095 domain-containing protein n=1 Tax=uncultured Tateyamaria sp. TaxID=455651 RepID=UPI00262A7D9F|nr:DUF3095 domain-containing protein [uncultured Tateyamaria sp.]